MSINKDQLTREIIRPTLKYLEMWSPSAENLMLGTCAQETNMGTYIRQLNKGPGMGIYSMERATYEDLWDNYLIHRASMYLPLLIYCSYETEPGFKALIYNLRYATAMARVHYWRVKEALPNHDDIIGLAQYWKKYYNTTEGKGTVDQFIDNYNLYVE